VDLLHLHAFGEDWVRDSAPYHGKLDLRYVTSEDLPEYAAKEYGLDPKGFQSLAYGFELDELPDDAARAALRREIRTQWSIPASAFVVGFAGRLTDQKDPLRWLSIAAAIEARHRESVFLVVGDGDLFNDARAAAAKLGLADRVVFVGYQRQAAQCAAAMDVLLMTSKYEGVPMMVLQALAHGTPVVSSDVGGIGRCLTPQTGRVVPVDASASAYAEAVLEWRDVPGSGPSIAATFREMVAARFDKTPDGPAIGRGSFLPGAAPEPGGPPQGLSTRSDEKADPMVIGFYRRERVYRLVSASIHRLDARGSHSSAFCEA